jgi:hypothetical protein
MRPIATTILRNNEIQRIPDNLTRFAVISEILKKHKEFLTAERRLFINTKNHKYTRAKRKKTEAKFDQKTKTRERESNKIENNALDNLQSSKGDLKKEEKINLLNEFSKLDKNLNDYNVENQLVEIIRINFIDSDHNIELELKKVGGEDDIIQFFFDKVNMCQVEHFERIIAFYEERQSKLIDIISKTLYELVLFLKFFTKFFDQLIKKSISAEIFKNATYNICQGVLAKEKQKCETIFLNFGLETILDAIHLSPVYRSEMCKIIFSLISNNSYSHYEVLLAIRRKFANKDEALYFHILVQCMTYFNEENKYEDEAIVKFYEKAISKGLLSHCDVIKIKSIYMVIQLMNLFPGNALVYSKKVFQHVGTWNWEILSLILIYCANILFYNNSTKENIERISSLIKEKPEESLNQQLLEYEEMFKETEELEDTCLSTIEEIFHLKSPNHTLKIGFIYLAEILHYYPKLSEKYMKMLIELDYGLIRSEVLDIYDDRKEWEYTGHSLAEKYRICGAPLTWMPIWVAGIFRDYVLKNSIQSLDAVHLEILQSIIITQNFFDEDAELWTNFYSDIKPYIFVSLSNSEFSNIALTIAQKLFTFEKILPNLLESTFDTLISTMAFIYDSGDDFQTDTNPAANNMKNLLTSISEIKSNECQNYIYRLIKTFAIDYKEIYLRSNLLELMNNISQQQRGEIFEY